MLHMIHASREGNWSLHLACIHVKCYHHDGVLCMTTLITQGICMPSMPDEQPKVLAFMETGGLSVQMNTDNAFGRVPVGKTTEETNH